jgi:hypothetical protein
MILVLTPQILCKVGGGIIGARRWDVEIHEFDRITRRRLLRIIITAYATTGDTELLHVTFIVIHKTTIVLVLTQKIRLTTYDSIFDFTRSAMVLGSRSNRCATPYTCKQQSLCHRRCSVGCGSVRKEYVFICSITHFSLCPFPKENLKVLSLLHFREQGPYQLGSLGCPGQRRDI